jgi:hypothetical protein
MFGNIPNQDLLGAAPAGLRREMSLVLVQTLEKTDALP